VTEVLGLRRCCSVECSGLHLWYGEENFLDDFHRAWAGGGFSAADMVGAGLDYSHTLCRMVGGVSQRLVLRPPHARFFSVRCAKASSARSDQVDVAGGSVMVKLPPVASEHPVPPVNVQVPVIEVPLSVLFTSVPLTFPVRASVFPPAATV